ncbi:MAG: C45 family peptidase [Thermodesulfobacteriota bacterium]
MKFDVTEKIITGGKDDFMEVRHMVMKGSNREIGRHLAGYAQQYLDYKLRPARNPLHVRAGQRFMSLNWPCQFERMKGSADFFGHDITTDQYDFSTLNYFIPELGCSCVFYPGTMMNDGHNRLTRNFDFTTGSLSGAFNMENPEDDSVATSRPFLFEIYPEKGYPSLFMCAYDLLGIALDGVNSEGLSVALMSVSESHQNGTFEPRGFQGGGLNEGQLPRFILETCATAEEARLAFLSVNQYYAYDPSHYIIADSSGDAFVWEMSTVGNTPHIINVNGAPLPVTNHLLHRTDHISSESMDWSLHRMDVLKQYLNDHTGKFTPEEIHKLCTQIAPKTPAGQGQFNAAPDPTRTLWTACYNLDKRSVEIDFYLGEDEGYTGKGIRRSNPVCVALS